MFFRVFLLQILSPVQVQTTARNFNCSMYTLYTGVDVGGQHSKLGNRKASGKISSMQSTVSAEHDTLQHCSGRAAKVNLKPGRACARQSRALEVGHLDSETQPLSNALCRHMMST